MTDSDNNKADTALLGGLPVNLIYFIYIYIIKAKGHFLGVNSGGFSLGVTPDATSATNVADGDICSHGAADQAVASPLMCSRSSIHQRSDA